MHTCVAGLLCFLGAIAIMAFQPLMAQTYPSRPVRLIVPFAPGGGSDLIGRLIAQKLTERLGQQVLVENKPGAGGNLGAELAVRAAPDGYTLLLIAGSYTVNPSLYKLSWDSANDITPIVQLSQGPFVLVVHPSVPVARVQQLLDYSKSHAGKVNWGHFGVNSTGYMYMEWMNRNKGSAFYPVPYKTPPQNTTALVAGETDFSILTITSSKPLETITIQFLHLFVDSSFSFRNIFLRAE